VTVVCNGRIIPATVAAAGFVGGYAEVTVPGLIPGTPYSLRCRCEVEDPDVDVDALWSPAVAVRTLRLPRNPAKDFPVEVLHVLCMSVVVRVRNPGEQGFLLLGLHPPSLNGENMHPRARG
jgi:hypothetical protein